MDYSDIVSRFAASTSPTCQIAGLADVYLDYFGAVSSGYFVEVGAYDGLKFSNTYGLAESGWSGLYIEPIKEFYERCIKNHSGHPGIDFLNAAVSNYIGSGLMRIDGALSFLDKFPDAGLKGKSIGNVKVDILDRILLARRVIPGFELLVIDTEGAEIQVLQGFTLAYWLPQMVIVETNDQPLAINFMDEYFAAYKKIFSDKINNIYVRT